MDSYRQEFDRWAQIGNRLGNSPVLKEYLAAAKVHFGCQQVDVWGQRFMLIASNSIPGRKSSFNNSIIITFGPQPTIQQYDHPKFIQFDPQQANNSIRGGLGSMDPKMIDQEFDHWLQKFILIAHTSWMHTLTRSLCSPERQQFDAECRFDRKEIDN